MNEKKKGYNLRLPTDLRQALRHFVATRDSNMKDEIIAAIRYWLEIHGAAPAHPSGRGPEKPKPRGGEMLHKAL